ncbi:hypothetical protein E2562_020294 [Oryza meyeriana var. granulata]|uniref:DUF1764 domain-containing protein n=1 Tax=Oryza meyeriana var. granulata TaxID=110450 RepID=A0A6G1DKL4_9ORYZ|nr:hypothetical protein E2562_020294 [Oryza meyeriana var. granulata]
MAIKSHKKKRPSASNPSINAKAPSSDQKPKHPKPTEEEREGTTAAAAAATEKPKKKKATNEIDEIFQATKSSGKKRKPQRGEESVGAKKPKERPDVTKKSKKARKGSKGKGKDTDDDDDDEGEEKRPRRRTTDGLAIYSAEELGFGKADAGGTPLCPFDCDCCF